VSYVLSEAIGHRLTGGVRLHATDGFATATGVSGKKKKRKKEVCVMF
jgi:hypothetical protein